MGWLTYLFLRVLHIIYSLYLYSSSRWRYSTNHLSPPLTTPRQKTPKHLAVAFALDSVTKDTPARLLEATENAIRWCKEAGIQKLTVFDKFGILEEQSAHIRAWAMPSETAESSNESEMEYPLTPPLSEGARSRSLSPTNESREPELHVYTLDWEVSTTVKKKKSSRNVMMRKRGSKKNFTAAPFTLHVISSHSAHSAIASTAQSLACQHASKDKFSISSENLNQILEGSKGFPSPDLLIVQHLDSASHELMPVLELHNFPPWQLRLAEIYHSPSFVFDEKVLCDALAEYGGAEMRFGK